MTDETLFANALEYATPAERHNYLNAACPDVAQRARLEVLLAAHDKASKFLKIPVSALEHTITQEEAEPNENFGFLQPSKRPDSLGRLDHYEVLEVLGKGGFGIVFRAFDTVLQRVVAVKVLAPELAVTSPAHKRFLREAISSAAVKHENVVQIYATQEAPPPYLVMEFIAGETLQQRLDRMGPFELSDMLRIGRQLAEGLAAAHSIGLIHRDIKPSNILIQSGPQQQIKITDFGLARAADDASLTRSGVVAGTPMYMAPEQAKGETLDQRADLFSLGSVLYVMCTGRPPFRAETTLAVLKRVAEDTPRPIREIIPEVPDWFCRIVEKLHAKNPNDRFQSAKEVAEVLEDCATQLKDNAKLTDFTHIPATKTVAPPARWKKVARYVLIFSLLYLIVWFGPFTSRYLSDTSVWDIEMNSNTIWYAQFVSDDTTVTKYRLQNAAESNFSPGTYTISSPKDDPRQLEMLEIIGASLWTRSYVRQTDGHWIVHAVRGEKVRLRVTFAPLPPR